MKMWDGRFSKPSDSLMEAFNNSLPFDKELIEEDILGSIAWANALNRIGVYSIEEKDLVVSGLRAILEDYKKGSVTFLSRDEDIHMAVERILVERIGSAGERLHTGRSRNDQVVTDVRLYLKKKLACVKQDLIDMQKVLVYRAENDQKIILPGYTHLQQAQPILLSHYWMSFFWIMEREKSRIDHSIKSTDLLPLGSGALAGSGFPVDRIGMAEELGFSQITDNSLDGVASRDFLLEALSSIASIGIQLSRYAEDLIIWSSREFGFVELDDAWSTGSSMMPQKKNPDSLELIRGKSGRFLGNYTRFATTLKGIGLTYYKDLQEDKEPLFDSLYQIRLVLQVFSQVLATLQVKNENIVKDLDPLLLATDLADYLVRKGVPFRQSHKIIGKLVAFSIGNKRPLGEISLEELKTYSEFFDKDVADIFSWEGAVSKRTVAGGTSQVNVETQIKKAKKILNYE